jgi:hypothetical protein
MLSISLARATKSEESDKASIICGSQRYTVVKRPCLLDPKVPKQ